METLKKRITGTMKTDKIRSMLPGQLPAKEKSDVIRLSFDLISVTCFHG
jgi:hypothetical protein